ncbi:hypothetical protein vseg_016013 [Gypsophila vaccaria]
MPSLLVPDFSVQSVYAIDPTPPSHSSGDAMEDFSAISPFVGYQKNGQEVGMGEQTTRTPRYEAAPTDLPYDLWPSHLPPVDGLVWRSKIASGREDVALRQKPLQVFWMKKMINGRAGPL